MIVFVVGVVGRDRPARIGKAKDLDVALKRLQAASALRLDVFWSHAVLRAGRVEAAAARHLAPAALSAGWFDIPTADARAALQHAILAEAHYRGSYRPQGAPDRRSPIERAVAAVGRPPHRHRDPHGHLAAKKALARHLITTEGLPPTEVAGLVGARPDQLQRWLR